MKSIPVLHLDLSDKNKEDIAILRNQLEQMFNDSIDKNKRIANLEEQIRSLSEEVININKF